MLTPNDSARLALFPGLVALATGQALVRLSRDNPGMPYEDMLDQIRRDYPDLERARLLIAATGHADDTESTATAQSNHVPACTGAENPVGASTEYQGGRM